MIITRFFVNLCCGRDDIFRQIQIFLQKFSGIYNFGETFMDPNKINYPQYGMPPPHEFYQNFLMPQMGQQIQEPSPQPEQKREYGCPCGKTYLSYPALFTHVKQKHDGKPPGKLLKPKTDKARGRPKIHIEAPEDDMSDGAFEFEEEMREVLEDVKSVSFTKKMELSEGTRSCQDMMSSFMNASSHLTSNATPILNCFFAELKYLTEQQFGDRYWREEKPTNIIGIINQMCKTHEQRKNKYPLSSSHLKDIVKVLWRWMYKNKWTDHKLIERKKRNLVRKRQEEKNNEEEEGKQ